MDIKGMHYDVKTKLNKVDSEQYKNLRIPEIDWALNEAAEIFVKLIAQPRKRSHLGFEINQRSRDDIRTIVKNSEINVLAGSNPEFISIPLPEDYMFYVSAELLIEKEGCGTRKVSATVRQFDDKFQDNSFYESSFEWRGANVNFRGNNMVVHTKGDFEVRKLYLTYIRKLAYMHNAQDFLPTQQYKLLDGTVLTGTQDCELPPHTHREIVDIAVLNFTGDLQIPDYQVKQAKLNLNQII